jgi:hypothetical protein
VKNQRNPLEKGPSIAFVAAWDIALMYQNLNHSEMAQLNLKLGDRFVDFLIKREKDFVDGKKDLPPLPSSLSVPENKRKELAATLEKSSPEKLPELIGNLPMSEYLALCEMTLQDKKLNSKLAIVANKITKVNIPEKYKVDFKFLTQEKGKDLTPELVFKCIDQVKKFAEKGIAMSLKVERLLQCDGVEFDLKERKPGKKKKDPEVRMMNGHIPDLVAAAISAPGINSAGMWLLDLKVPKKKKEKKEVKDGELADLEIDDSEEKAMLMKQFQEQEKATQKDFGEKLKKLLSNEFQSINKFNISILKYDPSKDRF